MKRSHTELARAKVNLTLKVLGKRDDGFHALETRMAPVSLADRLHFEEADAYELVCDVEGVPLDETNLVTMALRIFEREAGKRCHWKVTLEKSVPHGAGLGGGSGDAAAMLRALNQLEGTGFSEHKLARMAAEIGSDVAFFVYDSVCDCSGRGEIVVPVEGFEPIHALLIKPSFGVSTPTAYKAWQSSQEIAGIDYQAQQLLWGEVFNDLERPVFQKHRFLAEIKNWLQQQDEVAAALMSGSGSTMIAFLKSADAGDLAARVRESIDPTLWCEQVLIG